MMQMIPVGVRYSCANRHVNDFLWYRAKKQSDWDGCRAERQYFRINFPAHWRLL